MGISEEKKYSIARLVAFANMVMTLAVVRSATKQLDMIYKVAEQGTEISTNYTLANLIGVVTILVCVGIAVKTAVLLFIDAEGEDCLCMFKSTNFISSVMLCMSVAGLALSKDLMSDNSGLDNYVAILLGVLVINWIGSGVINSKEPKKEYDDEEAVYYLHSFKDHGLNKKVKNDNVNIIEESLLKLKSSFQNKSEYTGLSRKLDKIVELLRELDKKAIEDLNEQLGESVSIVCSRIIIQRSDSKTEFNRNCVEDVELMLNSLETIISEELEKLYNNSKAEYSRDLEKIRVYSVVHSSHTTNGNGGLDTISSINNKNTKRRKVKLNKRNN